MQELEKRKKQLELSRVKLAREELELKIMERQEEVIRLQEAIQKQLSRERELSKELKGE